jgi:arylsulfatase A-like enzyme
VVVNDWRGESAQDHLTLHEVLHWAGYDVAHIGVHHIRVKPSLEARLRFARWESGDGYAAHLHSIGFDNTVEKTSPFSRVVVENRSGTATACSYSGTRTGIWPGRAQDFKDLYWCREAAKFVRRPRTRPFALFLCLWAPHPPLRVPEPYASRFDPDGIDLPDNVGMPCEGEPSAFREGVPAQLAEGVKMAEWRRVWAAHLGLVNLADTGIGVVLETLHDVGLQDDTLTVFTVDHGDHLGQHEMYQKMEMYEPALRVPLVVAGPGIAVQKVKVPVSHLDVMPSLLELLETDMPHDLDGISLAGVLRKGDAPVPRPVFAQYSGNPVVGDTRRCVVSGRLKYVWSPPDGEELYDLKADPLEMTNLAAFAEHHSMRARLREALHKWGRDHADPVFDQ